MPDGFSMCSGIKWICFIKFYRLYISALVYIYLQHLAFLLGDFLGIHRTKWRCAGALAHTLVAEALRRTAHRATRALNKRGFLQIFRESEDNHGISAG